MSVSGASQTPARERPPVADDLHEQAERRDAARFLVMHPLVAARGRHSEQFRLVRRHEKALVDVFARGLGYRLHVDAGGARLFKAGLGRDPHRGLRRHTAAATPFTPRAYAMLALVLAALTRTRSQLLIDELVREVRSVAVDAQVDLDLDAIADRRALHAAVTQLVELEVLHERDGDLEHWVEQSGATSLLDVRRDLLALVVAAPLSGATSPVDLLETASLPSAAGGARVAVRRRLLESPILTTTDLDADQQDWWRRNRNREREWFADSFGLELELRAEGAVAIDPDDLLSDEEFPGRGASRHLALLLLDLLAASARDAVDPGELTSSDDPVWRVLDADEVLPRALALVATWSGGLRRDQREDPRRAVEHAACLLESFGLLRREPEADAGASPMPMPGVQDDRRRWWVHACAARYAAAPQLAAPSATGEASLFDAGQLSNTTRED